MKKQCDYFDLLCILRMWELKLLFFLNALVQCGHTNGFSPVWILIWQIKFCFRANDLSQCVCEYAHSIHPSEQKICRNVGRTHSQSTIYLNMRLSWSTIITLYYKQLADFSQSEKTMSKQQSRCQCLHLECIARMWLRKPLVCLNGFEQYWHTNGFSPVWILICSVKVLFTVNDLSQCGHPNGFSPVWILIWAVRLLLESNALRQYWHLNNSRCIFICLLK